MNSCIALFSVVIASWCVAGSATSQTLESFRAALKTYIDQTQPFRTAPGDGSESAIRLRQRTLAEAIRTTARPSAQQGDVFSPAVAAWIRLELAGAFAGGKAGIIRDGLEDQSEGLAAGSIDVTVNQMVAVPRVPPVLLETLPPLPRPFDFAFSGRTLILRDVDADVVVDFIRLAFPK